MYNSGITANATAYPAKAYNGMEMDDEVAGSGNSYTAEFWQYDGRLGRRWNVDPMAKKREWVSPYNVMQNNPINRIDPTGALDEWVETVDGQMVYDNRVTDQDDATALYGNGSTYRANGYKYTSSDGQKIVLGDYGFFSSNGKIMSSPDLAANSTACTNPVKATADALGRWLSIDPAQQLFPGLSPYNSLNNNPIVFVDPDGLWHRETTGKGADKREHLVADKGDDMGSLEKYFNKRRNRDRFTQEQKDIIRNQVKAYGQANAIGSVRTLSSTPSYEGFDMNMSEKLNLSINIHVGRTYLVGDDPQFQSLYYSKGGHVGIEFEGIVYNYFYKDPSTYDHNDPFALYDGQMRMERVNDYMSPNGNGNHAYANGDMDGNGVADVMGTDSYFTVYLTTGQYSKMRANMSSYSANPLDVPRYGIFGKRCTSMANTMLRKSDVNIVFMSSLRTAHPHQYYNALKKKGYAETVVR